MSNTKFDYSDIAPYSGKDFDEAVERLKQYSQLLNNFTDIISRHGRVVNKWKSHYAKKALVKRLDEVTGVESFQKIIVCDLFLKMIESSSIKEFTYSNFEEENKPHIYIGNHRDILLDTALLDLALYRQDKSLCEMVIGDNLLANGFVTDMFKVNGAITVRRNLTSASELMKETMRLSSYIRYCIEEKKQSVWIAQKSGRSKDGKDDTSPAILKMLYLAYREDKISFPEFLERAHIVPVAISYQYDPCDVTKSHEQIRKLKAEGCYDVYKKKKYEDIIDMVRGVRHYKGNVHINCGTEITGCEDVRQAVREIDRQIHLNYRLWDTNYFAYDYLNKTDTFAEEYKDLNTKGFIKHYKGLNPEVVDFVFNEYANPVRSLLNEKKS